MPWYVLYTKPRNEKKVSERLKQLGLTVYCPLVTVVKQWSDRKKKVQEPLLASYVFVRLDENEREKVFQVSGVVRYLYWLGKPAIVRDEEIVTLQSWLLKEPQKFQVEQLQPGSRITLNKGLFNGADALVQDYRGNKLRLVLESLGVVVVMHVAHETQT